MASLFLNDIPKSRKLIRIRSKGEIKAAHSFSLVSADRHTQHNNNSDQRNNNGGVTIVQQNPVWLVLSAVEVRVLNQLYDSKSI